MNLFIISDEINIIVVLETLEQVNKFLQTQIKANEIPKEGSLVYIDKNDERITITHRILDQPLYTLY